MFSLANEIGGQVIGAFENNVLVGFVTSFVGCRAGCVYLHSHILAVLPSHRDRGIGRSLKLAQREEAISRGIKLIEWTFDPLRIKNAYFNINRLGVIVRCYSQCHYGTLLSSLDNGLPTDRVTAEWWITSARVQTLLETGKLPEYQVVQQARVPGKVEEWRKSTANRKRALKLQRENGDLLSSSFSKGLSVLQYSIEQDGSGTFLLGRLEDMH
jgi:predicted GNAT superfamily acetyltransferase